MLVSGVSRFFCIILGNALAVLGLGVWFPKVSALPSSTVTSADMSYDSPQEFLSDQPPTM